MTELLSILYKLRIFTSDELSEALKGKVKSVEALLARYKQQGWIVAIRRNTYCMKDIASDLPVCDKWQKSSNFWMNHKEITLEGNAYNTLCISLPG